MTQSQHHSHPSASHQVAEVVERMQQTFQSLQQSLKRYRSQTRAEGVAKTYLSRTDLPEVLKALKQLPPRIQVSDEQQQCRLEGTLMRADVALRFVESGDGDAFEKVQVLEDAIRDFGLRLRERGLLLDTVPPVPAAKYESLGQVCIIPPRKRCKKDNPVDYGNAA